MDHLGKGDFLIKQNNEDALLLARLTSCSDDTFQNVLLQFSQAAAQGVSASALISLYCRASRDLFQADGSYYWERTSPDELTAIDGDHQNSEGFAGRRLKTSEQSIASEAMLAQQTVFTNHLGAEQYPLVPGYSAKSLMASPLVFAGQTIGLGLFSHETDPDFFNPDMAAKATILAAHTASLLSAIHAQNRLGPEHRWPEILSEVTQTLHAPAEPSQTAEAMADRLRILLHSPLVCILLRRGDSFELGGVAVKPSHSALSVRSRFNRKALQFACDLAERSLAAGSTISVSIDPATHSLGDLVPPGVLIAAPFRTSQAQGTVLVYPRPEGAFRAEEKSLVSSIAIMGGAAIANAELQQTAREQAHELDQILSIASELGSIGQLDKFMLQFVLRASTFLGFGRAFVGLLEGGAFHLRWKFSQGSSGAADSIFPAGIASRALLNREVFSTDDPTELPDANLDIIAKFKVKQLLTVPLLGSDGEVLGMLGVLDRLDPAPISGEDIRRARALAAQVAIALEVTRNLHHSEQHQRRAESLMGLALELNSTLRLPEFAHKFVTRAAEMLGASAGSLTIQQEGGLETVVLIAEPPAATPDASLLHHFDRAIAEALAHRAEVIVHASAAELFGPGLAEELSWADCTLMRLLAGGGELVGVLCLAGRGKPLAAEDQQLLQAIAGHGSVAIENARFFARIDRANRHWIEIFDAITDFIVAHDESGNVLRVNRSLAEFIGLQPHELIGVNMCALLATNNEAAPGTCPYCRSAGDGEDEYVHPMLERTFLVSTSQVHGASSEVLQTIHVLKDITDRREAERRYRELFDNIQEGLFFSTPDGRFVEVNDALVRMLGYNSREELLHADIRTTLYFSPQRHDELAAYMRAHGVLRNHEETLRRKDGSPVHVLINSFSVRDAQGRITQYRGLMLDISGLKTFQSELQRERDFSGKILNNTQSLILVADTAGLVSYANRRWYDMGYEQKYILGRPLEDLVLPARRAVLSEAYNAILAGNQVDNLDLQVLRADGRVGQFSVNLSPMRDDQGAVTSIVVVMSDITDAASLQAKLVHAEKMAAVGQLVSGVAHEVNNPLTAILGFADLLMENQEVPESARKDLRVILQEAQRTKQIVQNLLSFARQMPPQRKPVQLNVVLRRTLQLRAYDFHSRGVEVVEHLDQDLPSVIGDAHQLQQVFLNILNNSYDAVREAARAARIEIATSRHNGFIEISFRDNGHGISFPERIFDPFFTTKEVGEGTGLGLSICYGIVREHGGEILCNNNDGAEGATFIVRLPSVSEPASVGMAAGVKPQ